MKGTHDDPMELKPGETDRFYWIFGGANGFLATGDSLTGTPTITGAGATVAGIARNSTPLTYEGVEYAADTVVYADVSDIELGDKVELTCQCATVAGRIARPALWIRGVKNYS